MKKKTILLFGNSYFINFIQNTLNNYYDLIILQEEKNILLVYKMIKKSDIVLGLSRGYVWYIWFLAFLLNKKSINYWFGTDARIKQQSNRLKIYAYISKLMINKHITSSNQITYLLKYSPLRIQARTIILRIINKKEILKYFIDGKLNQHKVLLYLPERREKIYNIDIMLKIIKTFSNIKFLVVGHTGNNLPKLKNVIYYGKLDREKMLKLYNNISVLIRITINDGIAGMVQEALCFGKIVIYNKNIRDVFYVRSYEDIVICLNNIIQTNPITNFEIQKRNIQKFSIEHFVNELKGIIDA